jgi:hypothetical protein
MVRRFQTRGILRLHRVTVFTGNGYGFSLAADEVAKGIQTRKDRPATGRPFL